MSVDQGEGASNASRKRPRVGRADGRPGQHRRGQRMRPVHGGGRLPGGVFQALLDKGMHDAHRLPRGETPLQQTSVREADTNAGDQRLFRPCLPLAQPCSSEGKGAARRHERRTLRGMAIGPGPARAHTLAWSRSRISRVRSVRSSSFLARGRRLSRGMVTGTQNDEPILRTANNGWRGPESVGTAAGVDAGPPTARRGSRGSSRPAARAAEAAPTTTGQTPAVGRADAGTSLASGRR